MNFSEKWGKSVDDAVKLALVDLKLTPSDMDKVKVRKDFELNWRRSGSAKLAEVEHAVGT